MKFRLLALGLAAACVLNTVGCDKGDSKSADAGKPGRRDRLTLRKAHANSFRVAAAIDCRTSKYPAQALRPAETLKLRIVSALALFRRARSCQSTGTAMEASGRARGE